MAMLALLSIFGAASAHDQQFLFGTWFVGNWDVNSYKADLKSGQLTQEEMQWRYSLRTRSDGEGLEGSFYYNDTDSGESFVDRKSLRIDFDETSNQGLFQAEEQDGEFSNLFRFDFNPQSNGLVLSHGPWLMAEFDSFYQFNINEDTFTITVYSSESTEATVFIGQRLVETQELTFFQKHSSKLMLGAFFIYQVVKAKAGARGDNAGGGSNINAAQSEEVVFDASNVDEMD